MIKAVFFDFDETLVEAKPAFDNALVAVMKGKTDMKLIDTFIRMSHILDAARVYSRETWWRLFYAVAGLPEPTREELQRNTRKYWELVCDHMRVYPDTIETIKELRRMGMRTGIITDTDGTPGIKKERITRSGLRELFDVIIIAGEDTKLTKPDTEPFKKAAEFLSLSPKECVMVGDKPFTDIKGALDAGMYTIYVERYPWEIEVFPHYRVKNLRDVINAIRKITTHSGRGP